MEDIPILLYAKNKNNILTRCFLLVFFFTKTPFSTLRQIENDHITRNASVVKPHSAKAVTTQPEDSNLQELKGMIKQINTRLDSYESRWNQHRGRGKGRGRGQYNKGKNESTQKDYQCWRCGQMGHLKIGCKVRMDHSRQNLNSNKPMPGERS